MRYGQDSEQRILRARISDLYDLMDRTTQSPGPYSTPCMAVQIVDDGAMPTAPDNVFFANVVNAIGGTEVEGGTADFNVDATRTVPIVVLNGVPSVGDYLLAEAVGGRWVAEIRACKVTIDVKCSGMNVVGDTVTVKQGATTVRTGTTDSSGNVMFYVPLPVSNPYTIDITGGGNPAFSMSQDIACGGSYDFDVCSGGSGQVCTPCNIPDGPLVLSWTNPSLGGGSTTLTGGASPCVEIPTFFSPIYMKAQFSCNELLGGINLLVTYYNSGTGCTGTSGSCLGTPSPFAGTQLQLISYTCDPFSFTWQVNSTCGLSGMGYETFTVSA